MYWIRIKYLSQKNDNCSKIRKKTAEKHIMRALNKSHDVSVHIQIIYKENNKQYENKRSKKQNNTAQDVVGKKLPGNAKNLKG